MGQYFLLVNLDKKEYVLPHTLGMGLKIGQIVKGPNVLPFLLARSGSNTDELAGYSLAGSWATYRIIVIGDYDISHLYATVEQEYKDISLELRNQFEQWLAEPLPKQWGI